MVNKVLTILLIVGLVVTSCKQIQKKETTREKVSNSKTEKNINSLIGTWVQPNPINAKEVQGFTINQEGTMKSVNMATLVYKKWWKEADTLVLVAESIGNGISGMDTTKYEIVKLNDKELELKERDLISKYKKQ